MALMVALACAIYPICFPDKLNIPNPAPARATIGSMCHSEGDHPGIVMFPESRFDAYYLDGSPPAQATFCGEIFTVQGNSFYAAVVNFQTMSSVEAFANEKPAYAWMLDASYNEAWGIQ